MQDLPSNNNFTYWSSTIKFRSVPEIIKINEIPAQEKLLLLWKMPPEIQLLSLVSLFSQGQNKQLLNVLFQNLYLIDAVLEATVQVVSMLLQHFPKPKLPEDSSKVQEQNRKNKRKIYDRQISWFMILHFFFPSNTPAKKFKIKNTIICEIEGQPIKK